MTSFESFRPMCERDNFVFDSLICLEPVERLQNNVMKFRSFGDSTNSRVKDK